MTARRRPWIYQLRWVIAEYGLRAVWSDLFDDLMAGGRHWLVAVRIANRRYRVAAGVYLGLEQAEIAARLGVSLRTAAEDARAVRRVVLVATRRERSDVPAGPIPRTPDDIPVERRSRRR